MLPHYLRALALGDAEPPRARFSTNVSMKIFDAACPRVCEIHQNSRNQAALR